jgi:hypothetical protein
MKHLLTFAAFIALFAVKASAQSTVSATDAAKHIGKTVTICEKVFNGKQIASSNITLLYLGGYYPNQALTVIIKDADKSKFKGRPEVDDKGKDFSVTGQLITYNGKPAIVVNDPGQLKIVLMDNARQPMFPGKK